MTQLSIMIPVYNEEPTVETAIRRILDTDYPVPRDEVELVIVDDGSTDGTAAILRRLADSDSRINLVTHERNSGKGDAVRTAIGQAAGTHAAIMDADLEYEASDIGRLLEPILEGEAEEVFGSRGFESHSAFNFWFVMGNKGVTLAANLLFNCYLSDIMTCHKVMPTEVWRALDLKKDGFDIEPEIAGKVLAHGHRIYEVPVRYRARGREEGKKLTATDGLRVVRTLVECRLAMARG
jgi:dolichol-phosphate hexosyltransferase